MLDTGRPVHHLVRRVAHLVPELAERVVVAGSNRELGFLKNPGEEDDADLLWDKFYFFHDESLIIR